MTKLKARMYNNKYLDELVFWRDVLSGGTPRIILNMNGQALIAPASLLSITVSWPEIVEPQKRYRAQPHDDDLFTLADLDNALDIDEDEDLDDY